MNTGLKSISQIICGKARVFYRFTAANVGQGGTEVKNY